MFEKGIKRKLIKKREIDKQALKRAKLAKVREHNEAVLRDAAFLASMLKKRESTKDRLGERLLNSRVRDATIKQITVAEDANYQESFPNQCVVEFVNLTTRLVSQQGPLHLIMFFAMTYGVGFAVLSATVMHVILFHGREIWEQSRTSSTEREMDIHTKLMSKYRQQLASVAMVGCSSSLACVIAIFFTLPIGIITAITNQLNMQ
ncbi:hypothetical protein CASFOL_007550 [Castilleja foliolosa]|uniref:Uncharacterized protein n=2 Tax=Castilleja foliolosa TaxID=1961234 RepID=A0ABD3EA42_9LAMI